MRNFPWWIFRYLKDYKFLIVVSVVSLISHAFFTSYLAYFVKTVVNTVFVERDERMIKLIPFILILLAILDGIAYFVNYYSMSYIGQITITKLREDLYRKVLFAPLELISTKTSAGLISRIVNDTSLLQDFTSRQIATFLRSLFTAVALIVVLFVQDFELAIIGIVGLPFVGYVIFLISRKIRRYTAQMQERLESMMEYLFEGAKNLKEIKIFVAEDIFFEKFKKENRAYLGRFMKIRKVEGIYHPIVELISAIVIGFLIFYGGMKIVRGELSPGAFFSFVIALIMAYEPVRKLGQNYGKIQQSSAVAERIKGIMVLGSERSLRKGSKEFGSVEKITFADVWFKYPGADRFALEGINVSFEKGKRYAIVGKTGSGKSTLVGLIPRFYEPTKGLILADHTDLREFNVESLRRKIGFVSQDIVIFSASVRENIAISKPDASFEEIVESAKIANIHSFIESLPNGYDTLIGEGGISLSGGQKQRIAIARAVLRNPEILILDEATSALDSETESAVQKAIESKFKDKIVISIAHRLNTALSSDEVIFMKDGKIKAVGSHDELYRNVPEYKVLCDIQFGGSTS